MTRAVIVFGGYGTFGRLVSAELVRLGARVIIAGRDAKQAEDEAQRLGATAGRRVDITDPASTAAALEGVAVAANCAGPFHALGTTILDACVAAGCHYVDIADDRAFAAKVRAAGARFAASGLAAVTGCSSLPGISGALAALARARGPAAPPRRARVTLFIGNDNPKGTAAIEAAVSQLGRPFAAPQGTLRGFRDREVVNLPPPFGRRAVYNFESPEYDLFPALTGASEVVVKAGFELRAATAGFATLAALGIRGARTARLLAAIGRRAGGRGHSGGVIMSELFWPDGEVRTAALHGADDAQRMAALPCALAAEALVRGAWYRPTHPGGGGGKPMGAMTAYDLLGAEPLLDAIVAQGFELTAA